MTCVFVMLWLNLKSAKILVTSEFGINTFAKKQLGTL